MSDDYSYDVDVLDIDDIDETESDTGTVVVGEEPNEAEALAPLSEQLDTTVRKEVGIQLALQAKTLAEGVVEELMTDEVAAILRAAAVHEAQTALAPPPEPEPEPEPQLFYRDVGKFVDGYIAQLYRREVSARGLEKTRRWCPRWWEHGEALARLEALWRAWEEMRHGKGAEMAGWWIQFADPTMAVLLDPAGPFAACSVAEGHHCKPPMPRLPLVEAPAGYFEDGYTPDPTEQPLVSSSLELPPVSLGRSRVIKVIPG